MKTKHLFAGLLLFTTGCSSTLTAINSVVEVKNVVTNESILKTKVSQSDPRDMNNKKGLLVYGYDNGASIQYGSAITGNFETSLRPIANEAGSKDLKEFTILFTETISKEQFGIKVFVYESYSYVAVNYKGENAGINYYESQWVVGTSHGYSGIANNENRYTFIDGVGDINLSFDPIDMTVKTTLRDGAYYNVWDFKQINNDGKFLKHNLHSFNEYDISIVFDSIATNGRGDLLLYSFAGNDLSNSDLNTDKPIINTKITSNLVLGQTFTFPEPVVSNPKTGLLDSKDVSISLFDSEGNEISLLNKTFKPTKVGKYYAYYSYSKEGINSYTYECLEVINPSDVVATFSDVNLPTHEGQGKIITIPAVSLTTNLGVKTDTFDCYVSVSLDGFGLPQYQKMATGQNFALEHKGTYSFVFGNSVTSVTHTHTIIVDGRLTINEIEEANYVVGDTFHLPKLEFYKGGKKVNTKADIYDPFDKKQAKDTFEITQEGIYRIEYKSDAWFDPIVKEVTVRQLQASNFTDETATYTNMVTDNSIEGVKLSLKNGVKVQYNRIIDLNEFKFDDTLSDKSLNKELIKLYVQPSIQGTADLEGLYIQLTDVNNSTNFLTIRCRFIEAGTFRSGSLIRAKSSTQGAYVGYYYDFYTTKMEVNNATSHEEGGFTSYCNFTHICNGEDYKNMGLPLYFDYPSGRLYSRPAWLKGHNYNAGEPYENMNVPWLVYDFKADSPNLSGGNTPWGGFSTGKVKLSIYGKGISSQASIFVTSINGEKIDNKLIIDETGPNIEIDNSPFDYVEATNTFVAPKGIVNKPYKVFDYTSTDDLSDVKKVDIEVKSPSNTTVNITDGHFVPTTSGVYKVNYIATDVFNNKTTKTVDVEVVGSSTPLTMSVNGSIPTTLTYGETLVLPTATYSGGSGKLNFEITAKTEKNEVVDIKNGHLTANVPGKKYTITYCVSDYLNQKVTKTYEVNIKLDSKIIFDSSSVVLPSKFMNNDVFYFTDYYAISYDAEFNPTMIPAKIKVVDGGGEKIIGKDHKYTVKSSDSVTTSNITLIFEHNGVSLVDNHIIPIQKIGSSAQYIASFFNSKNANVNSNISDITFASNGNSKMSMEFLRPIDAHQMFISMGLNLSKLKLSDFKITLQDIHNSNQTITLTYAYKIDPVSGQNKLFCSLNNSSEQVIYNIGDTATLAIDYSEATKQIKDVTGATIFNIDKFLDGSEFNGFSSGSIYFSLEANGIIGSNFEIKMQKINNQGTNAARSDFEKPVILINGIIANRAPRGSEIIIPSAVAYDVLNPIKSFTVSVSDLDGNYLLDDSNPNKDYKITLEECKTYVVTYMASDQKGNKTIEEFYIYSIDEVGPELKFNGSLPTYVSVGSSINLPSYQVIDNDPSTCKVSISVFNPDGSNHIVKKGTISFPKKGRYVVTYYVVDAYGNCNHYVFNIVAR